MRFFNTAGPVNPQKHYCLPPLARLNVEELLGLIHQEKYFVLHAPRQTGKTSALLALMEHLNTSGEYRCVYVNVEVAQAAREDVSAAMQAILSTLGSWTQMTIQDDYVARIWPDILREHGPFAALGEVLSRWSAAETKPVVLLIDEIDALIGDTLIAVLRQLRAGYQRRPAQFPQSVILCGVRDVRDYRIHSSRDKAIITGGSAFNVKAESLRLGDFIRADVETLYHQHTEGTGQIFTPEALTYVWELTQGQPWLVNALGYETCFKMKAGRDRTQPITEEQVAEGKENLILRRETHLDQLADKLEEPRVQRVIEPLLAGEELTTGFDKDDVSYVLDLGLIRQTRAGAIRIANLIYQEVIPRELGWNIQSGMSEQTQWYVTPEGRLDMSKLLAAFQAFFREHSEHWVERFQYKEAGPQLLLQAFLQRIVNGGGRIEREYGLGHLRTDLLVIWPYPEGVQRTVIELKVLHKSLEQTIHAGIEQTWQYLDRCGAAEGHLVIFDRTPGKPWEEKLFQRTETVQGTRIQVWGM
ncbi:MAG: ATP-binding protein [Deltaproteobacteria bacterium]|nr:ATP-binding protein [Deltaproteobacteria bacterium]